MRVIKSRFDKGTSIHILDRARPEPGRCEEGRLFGRNRVTRTVVVDLLSDDSLCCLGGHGTERAASFLTH